MRAARSLAAVDSHTEGMPTRVVVGGVAPIPGATMLERKLHFEAHMDDLRLLLMREPRGHSAMSGAILQPATRADADLMPLSGDEFAGSRFVPHVVASDSNASLRHALHVDEYHADDHQHDDECHTDCTREELVVR